MGWGGPTPLLRLDSKNSPRLQVDPFSPPTASGGSRHRRSGSTGTPPLPSGSTRTVSLGSYQYCVEIVALVQMTVPVQGRELKTEYLHPPVHLSIRLSIHSSFGVRLSICRHFPSSPPCRHSPSSPPCRHSPPSPLRSHRSCQNGSASAEDSCHFGAPAPITPRIVASAPTETTGEVVWFAPSVARRLWRRFPNPLSCRSSRPSYPRTLSCAPRPGGWKGFSPAYSSISFASIGTGPETTHTRTDS